VIYKSTREGGESTSFFNAVLQGLAPGGGLYMPESLPTHTVDFDENYAAFAAKLLTPFLGADADAVDLKALCDDAFDFPVPLLEYVSDRFILALFHGPSLSFKDFGARFLARVINAMPCNKERLLMVATSGDTGSAVASAFHGLSNVRVVVLYPKGRVSKRQAHQLSCWGDNITTLAVDGSFDDCQRLVKSAFDHEALNERFQLTTANSINIGRLLPQVVYYAYQSLAIKKLTLRAMNVVIPSGNLGNVTAAFFAKQMGYPIDEIVLAQNANQTVVDYLQTQTMPQDRQSIATLANAMDVGIPSNFERLEALYPDFNDFKRAVRAFSVNDAEIKEAIVSAYKNYTQVICPHTATAYHVARHAGLADKPWVIAATAHPCKFESIVEPLLGVNIPVPESLAAQLSKPRQDHDAPADLNAILDAWVF
jgi:threonine synthase